MKIKLIAVLCIVFLSGLFVFASGADQVWKPDRSTPGQNGEKGRLSKADREQWLENWKAVFGEDVVQAAARDERATIHLVYGSKRIKVNTLGGGAFEGTFIEEGGCYGGDIRGLFTVPGEFAMAFFNWNRYDYRCGFLAKGDMDLPPPLSFTFMNEVGLGTGAGTLELGSPGVWFHESVNDEMVQDWVAVSPNWSVETYWWPSPSYVMVGNSTILWNLAYYGARTYPRPAHDGFQYEVCFRKKAGNGTSNMSLYFNGDGTMDNCIYVGITAVDGWYSAFERNAGTLYTLVPWTQYEPNLFVDDPNVTERNVLNMVKVNVYNDGLFDIYINENYVASGQALYNFSGYVGLTIVAAGGIEAVSCDNMTLSTVPLPRKSVSDRKIHQSVRAADPAESVSPR